MRRSLIRIAVVTAVVALSTGVAVAKKPPSGPSVTYSMIELHPNVVATGVNDAGDVVCGPFLHIAASATPVWLPGLSAPAANTVILDAIDIGDAILVDEVDTGERTIVGNCSVASGPSQVYRGIVKCAGSSVSFVAFETLSAPEGYLWFTAHAINNLGDVVGEAEAEAPEGGYSNPDPVIWWAGTSGLDVLIDDPTYGRAYDINDAGQATGYRVVDGEDCGFIYTPFTPGETGGDFENLVGLRKRPETRGAGINSAGEVAGKCVGPYYYDRAVFYPAADDPENLGTLFGDRYSWSRANGINDAGQIVGTSGEAHDWTDPGQAGFLYAPGSGMLDLGELILNPPAGWDPRSLTPTAIGNTAEGIAFGHICGTVTIDGVDTAFVLVPVVP